MHDEATNAILREVVAATPKGTNIYLVGGAVRNAVYYALHGKKMVQRDYDILVIGDSGAFIKNIRSRGFIYGKIRRKRQTVLKKKKIAKPQSIADYVVLDAHTICDEKTPMKNLQKHANFTVNGFTLPLKAATSKLWYKKLVALPTALADLKSMQLRVNVSESPGDPFAAIRFMSKGFKAPTSSDIRVLLQSLQKMEKWRYEKNVRKILSYVGGEDEVRALLKKLKVKVNIFDFDAIRNMDAS